MTKLKKIIFVFLAALQSGCTTHSIIKSNSPTDDFTCKLVNAHAKMVDPEPNALKDMIGNQAKSVRLGIKKLDLDNLKIWIEFSPTSSKEDPLKNPGMILKLYKKGNVFQEYKMNGDLYTAYDAFNPSKSSKVQDIWPDSQRVSPRLLEEKAIEFIVSSEQFKGILESDMTKMLVQTHYEPLIILIEKDDFIPLKEFKKECLS